MTHPIKDATSTKSLQDENNRMLTIMAGLRADATRMRALLRDLLKITPRNYTSLRERIDAELYDRMPPAWKGGAS